MTINERVKHFRKNVLHISQTEFANKLGMKQTGVSYMERDGSTVTDQTIKAICLLFNVNEDWLRNGSEPMFVEPDTFSLDEFVKQRGATDLELQIVKTYFDLDPDTRKMLVDHFRKGLAASVPAAVEEKTVEELEEEYKKTVLNSALKKGSTALNTTNGTATDKKAVNGK